MLFLLSEALAHTGLHSKDIDVTQLGLENLGWNSWEWPPLVVGNLLLFSILYGLGWRRLKAQRRRIEKIPTWQAVSFYSGILTVLIALASPIKAFSEVLGWVHMVQHTLLMMVAAPLFVFGSPGYVILWAIPQRMWKRAWPSRFFISHLLNTSRFSRPLAIWISYASVLWIFHVPVLYEAALDHQWVHDLQHLAFFCSSYLFWRIVFDPYFRHKLNPAAGIMYLFFTSLHAMMLGVLMALSPRVWYSPYEITAPYFGFSALQDQQLAGYIMWMPAGMTFVIVAVILLLELIRQN